MNCREITISPFNKSQRDRFKAEKGKSMLYSKLS